MIIVPSSHKSAQWVALLSSALFAISGCSDKNSANIKTPGHAAPAEDTYDNESDGDSLKTYNRVMYEFNYTVDGVVLKPVTIVYRTIVPEKGRMAVSNVINNLYTPVVFANSVLQTDPQNSFATLWRFILNTTFGLGGVIDFASEAGLKNRPADFGQTLGVYGVKPGPYVVLPIIGPSNARDTVGHVADAFMNPFTYAGNTASIALAASTAVDARSRNTKLIDDVYSSSLDPYTTFRSGYMQKREEAVRRAKAAREKALDQVGIK